MDRYWRIGGGARRNLCVDQLTKTCSSLNGGMIATNRGTGALCDHRIPKFSIVLDMIIGLKHANWVQQQW